MLLVPRAAHADDAAILSGVRQVMAKDFAGLNYGAARTRLRQYLDQCKRSKCDAHTIAEIQVDLGVVAAAVNQADDARAAFVEAMTLDDQAALPKDGVTPATKALWEEAKKKVPPKSPQAQSAADLAAAAVAAEGAGRLKECIEKDRASLAIEDRPAVRLHQAVCEQKSGKLLDALEHAHKALETAIARKETAVVRAAQARVEDLLARMPKVQFVPPPGATELRILFDNTAVPPNSFYKKFNVDPGTHRTRADGVVNGTVMAFEATTEVAEGATATIVITLKPENPRFLTPQQIDCMKRAQTQEDVAKCLPSKEKALVVRAGVDVGGYLDTTATRVVTPSIHASATSPTGGWNVGAAYTVDMLTSASPDLVSTASRRFKDTRHAVGLNGGWKPGQFGFDASASLSVESDYTSRAGRIALLGDFNDKQFTPRIAIGRMQDTIGRAGTSFDVFSNDFATTIVEAGATAILGPRTVLVVGGSAQFERGDQSKPYRLIPMFDRNTYVPVGASATSVNANRLPLRPYEQLPLERDRYAIGMRYAHRYSSTTLRLEQRLYRDTWSQWATTTDFRYIMAPSGRLSVWPHVRIHAQTGANFYHRMYLADLAPVVQVPIFRTTDRELSPNVGLTLGAGARLELSPPEAKVKYALLTSADALFNRYFDALYIRQRLALYGNLGFEVVFE